MNQYIDLSIKKIEIKNPKRDLKPIVNLQNKVILTLSHEEYYYPTDEKTIEECLKGDYILLGVYNRDHIIKISLLQQVLRVRMAYSFQDLLLIGWRFLEIKSCVMNLLWLIWSTEAMEYRRDLWMLR